MFNKLKQSIIQKRKEKQREQNIDFGEWWEQFVRDMYFIDEYFECLEKTHPFRENEIDYIKSSLNPDYKFRCINTNKNFYVECKAKDITNHKINSKERIKLEEKLEKLYQEKKYKEFYTLLKENMYDSLLEICNEDQFYRYKKLNHQKQEKVLFMLHLEDKNLPEEIGDTDYLIPIDNMLTNNLFFEQIEAYLLPDKIIGPYSLWSKFLVFYGFPGYCIRCNDKIKLNSQNPFCYDCWEQWFQYKKFTYEEKYCHKCGKLYKTSAKKPLCQKCFKTFPFMLA